MAPTKHQGRLLRCAVPHYNYKCEAEALGVRGNTDNVASYTLEVLVFKGNNYMEAFNKQFFAIHRFICAVFGEWLDTFSRS